MQLGEIIATIDLHNYQSVLFALTLTICYKYIYTKKLHTIDLHCFRKQKQTLYFSKQSPPFPKPDLPTC